MSSRKSRPKASGIIRDKDDAILAIATSLREIKALCDLYDSGFPLTSRTIAAVLHRILFEEIKLAGLQRKCGIVSFGRVEPRNLLPDYPLTMMHVKGDNTTEIKPALDRPPGLERIIDLAEWQAEAIFMESESQLKERVKKLPVEKAKKEKRIIVSRAQFIKGTRNETGAHFDRAVTEQYLQIFHSNLPIGIGSIDDSGAEISTISHPEKFKVTGDHGSASLRAIASEIMSSFQVIEKTEGGIELRYYVKQTDTG